MTDMHCEIWKCPSFVQSDGHSVGLRCKRIDRHEADEDHHAPIKLYLLNTRGANDPGAQIEATMTWREPAQPKLCGKLHDGGKCLMPRDHAGECCQVALR